MIRQVSVFIQNQEGKLGKVLDILCSWGELHVNHLIEKGENVQLNCNNI